MTTTKKEHLSAMLDGEAGEFETRRLLQEIDKDGMQESLSNYALIGEVMRSPSATAPIASNDFLARLNEKIEHEEGFAKASMPLNQSDSERSFSAIAQNDEPNKKRTGPIFGFAIAASLAALAVVGIQNMMQTTSNGEQATLATADSKTNIKPSVADINSLASIDLASQNNDEWQYDPAIQAQIRHYVNEHNKYTHITGLVPTIRAASYKTGY